MQQVDIFLITSSHAPKLKKAWYRYILVCRGETRKRQIEVKDVTGHQLVMKCAVAALQKIIRPAMITIHTDSYYLANGHGKMAGWKSAGWKRENGQTLKNAELWKKFYSLMQSGSKWSRCCRIPKRALLERNKGKTSVEAATNCYQLKNVDKKV